MQYSGNAVKQLLTLQIFDILCGQVDRHLGNYTCVLREVEGKNGAPATIIIESIMGIDNDLSFGNLTYDDILKRGSNGYGRIANIENGKDISIPAIDNKLARKILEIEPAELDYAMADILNKKERECLVDRLKGIQKAIRKREAKEEKLRSKKKPYGTKFIKN